MMSNHTIRRLIRSCFTVVACLISLSFTAAIDFEKMRSRELRKHLLKLGHDREELNKILDRAELKQLAEEFYSSKQKYDDEAAYRAKGVKFSIACIILASIFIFWEPISGVFGGMKETIDGFVYQLKERIRLIRMSLVNRFPLAAISLLLAIFLEILQPMIQISILASWVIPSSSSLRRFLIPMPNFQITVNHFLGQKEGKSTAPTTSFGDIGNMGVNIAPMVLMWISSYVKHKLEDFGASRLISVVEAKQKRRDDREAVRSFKSKLNSEPEFIVMDYADDYPNSANSGNIASDERNYIHSASRGFDQPAEQKVHQRNPVGYSPFEQQQSTLKSAFLQHVREGTEIDFEDSAGPPNNSAVDDGDFWATD